MVNIDYILPSSYINFVPGQIYVGLFWAHSLKGLQVVGLNVASASSLIYYTLSLTNPNLKVKMNAIAAKWMKDKFGSV
jgi:hypothetical protein